MALAEYRRKRQFDGTPEPEGGEGSGKQLHFVVQKHDASRLHYDFRLELDGVLLSWAVPKGPSLDPGVKHLAMQVEDHPMDYRLFEGTIPEGNYGAGTVMVWDEGSYSDADDSYDLETARKNIKAGYKKGDLKFTLHGSKLKGSFVLVKIKNDRQGSGNSWLLIKHKDAQASTKDITKEDRSALSNKTMRQIASTDTRWIGGSKIDLSHTPKAAQPDTLAPMLAALTDQAFDDPNWLYEIKWDGYRIMAHVKNGQAILKSRNDKDYTEIFAPVSNELKNTPMNAIIDGEMVVVDKDGKANFGALQNYQKTGEGNLVYYAFDLPYADGHDLRELPLRRRKEILSELIAPFENVRFSDHIEGRGVQFYQVAAKKQLEGIMAKEADSQYLPGKRSRSWLKIKTQMRQEVVIGGFTEPRGSRKQIGALIVGVYDDDHKLNYIGHVGGGFNERILRDLHDRLEPLKRKTSPFAETFKANETPHWVKPELIAEVKFAEWTADSQLRQPIFVGLREDKDPKTVRRERATAPPKSGAPTPIANRVPKNTEKTPKSDGNSNRENIAKTKVELTHLDKKFWPKAGYTKGDVVAYYDRIAPVILPYLKNRPESLNRHPSGIDGPNFFQKDVDSHPDWVKTVPIFSESKNEDIHWLICNDRDALLYLIQLGCIEINPWHSRVQQLDKPDYCLIDLDAKTNTFEDIITVAKQTHTLLEELGVPSVAKTSGKTGIHICVPLGAKYSFDQSKQFAQLLVNLVHERLPELTSVERAPDKRRGKIYLDYLQNRKGQTMATAYSLRPVPDATVSTPLKWTEVRKGLDPKKFTIGTTAKRIDKVGDLWEPVMGRGIDLKKVLSQLSKPQ